MDSQEKSLGNKLTKNVFNKNKSYVGEIGEFSFDNKTINHELNIYQVINNKFVEVTR